MSRRTEAAFAVAISLGAAGLAVATPWITGRWAVAAAYYERAAFFPGLALVIVAVFGAWTAWQAWRGAARDLSDEVDAADTSVGLAVGGAALMAAYIALAIAVGYSAATFVAVLALSRWVRLSWRFSLTLAVAVTALLYATFVVGFKVWFPAGALLAGLA